MNSPDTHHELPAPPGRIILFALIALSMGGLAAYYSRLPRCKSCVGTVAVRTMVITAPCDGMLAELLVREGDDVEIGTPLARLHDSQLTREIALKEQQLATLDQELKQSQASVDLELEWRLHTLHSEITDIQLRSAGFLREQYDYEMQRNMLADMLNGDAVALIGTTELGAVSTDSSFTRPDRLTAVMRMEAAQNAAEVAAAQVEICEQQVQRLQGLKTQLPEQVRKSTKVDVVEAQIEAVKGEIELLRGRETDLIISSPAIGKVGLYRAHAGGLMNRGQNLVELLDNAQRYLIVHVPSQQIAEYPLGKTVKLNFPGREIREGRVSHIAPQTLDASVSLNGNYDSAVIVHVEQTGAVWPDVPVGTRVLAFP